MNEQNQPPVNPGPANQPPVNPGPANPAPAGSSNAGSGWAWSPQEESQNAPYSPPSAGWSAPPSAGWSAPQDTTQQLPQQTNAPSAGWGAPPSGPQRYGSQRPGSGKDAKPWTPRRILVVAGVAVVVAAGTAAGIYTLGGGAGSADAANVAQNQNGNSGLNGQPGGGQVPGGPGQAGGGSGLRGGNGAGLGGGLVASIHSEYVILNGSTYVTMADQLGDVTDVSATSVTVKSADGYTKAYVLNSSTTVGSATRQRGGTPSTLTLADVKVGSTLRVTATKNGDTYTATALRLTTAKTSGQGTPSGQGTS